MLDFILRNESLFSVIMAFIVFLLVGLIKQPIKLLTKKLDEKIRKIVNSVILLFPFGLGILAQFLCNHFGWTEFSYETNDILVEGVLVGAQSIAMYGLIERTFGLKVKNPYKTGDGAEIVETANEIVKDKKITVSKIVTLFSKLFNKKEQVETTEGEKDTIVEDKVDNFESKLKEQLDKIK